MGVEYVVRKVHFRYYHGGPLDGLFEALFPAENTPQGRRSAESIRRAREDLAAGGDGVLRGPTGSGARASDERGGAARGG